jgi:hypothetical protein
MRQLDRARLLESPDHPVIDKPWLLDVVKLHCWWHGGNDGLDVEVVLTNPGRDVVRLRFAGVTDLTLDGFRPLVGLRILDATRFLPEIPAPICVLHRDWARGNGEPYFWASSVAAQPEPPAGS